MPEVMKTVGRYEILREVGRGGMAMVYLARQTDLDRFVALKELGAFHASDPSFAQRFLRESRVAGSLSHPNIVTVHDYFEHEGTPYIAMEYVERGSLRPYVGHMTMAQSAGVLEGLLAGLAHGEQNGIVHRDLKPENLMVTSDGRVKIADFGIAKATNQMQTGAFLTATGTTVGTPTYMAPEQAMAQEIGPSTDLYSVGCMAFEMFTGRVPFHDTDAPMAILLRHVNEPIAPAKSVDPSIDQDISDWIEKLLLKDPSKRIQSASEAWDEFEEVIIGLQGPRWRRSARLLQRAEQIDTPAPLTPAPFEGTSSDAAVSDGDFQSFAWGTPAAGAPAGAPPGPATPPPSDAAPLPPEPTVGPPTPLPPSEAVPAPAADADGDGDPGFVTFGAPAAAEPPAVAPGEPLAGPASAPAPTPAAEPPPLEAGDPATAAAGPPIPAAEAPAISSGDPLAVDGAPAAPPSDILAGAPTAPPAASPAPAAEAPAAPPAEAAPADAPVDEAGFETYIAPAPLRPPTEDAPADAPALPAEPAPAPPPEPAAAPPPPPPPPAPTPPPPAPAAPPVQDIAATVMPQALKPPAAPLEEKKPAARPRAPKPAPKPKAQKVAKAPKAAKPAKTPKAPKAPKPAGATRAPGQAGAKPGANTGVLVGFGIAAVVAAVIGFVIAGSGGGSGSSGGSATPTKAASSADLAAKFPSGWSKLAKAPAIPGLALANAVALAPKGDASGPSVVLGVAGQSAANSTLLPSAFRNSLGLDPSSAPKREAVRLSENKLEAYRYAGLNPKGLGKPVTVFASPTSKGVATVACIAPGPDCEAIANTLKLTSGTPLPVGPSKTYAAALSTQLGGLNAKVQAGRIALQKGKTGKAQAKGAAQISTAYLATSKSLGSLALSPADRTANTQLADSMKATGTAYAKLASAASKGDKGGFAKAGKTVATGEQAIAGALRGLQAAGYKVAQG